MGWRKILSQRIAFLYYSTMYRCCCRSWNTLHYCIRKSWIMIDNTKAGVFASNGYGAFSPDGYSLQAAFIAEFVLTIFFLLIILGATDKFANGKFAGVAIGLGL